LRQAAVRVATLLGGVGTDWAFVENATAGMNAIVASLTFGSEDEILCLSQVYNAVANVLRYHCQRRGAQIVVVRVPVPFERGASNHGWRNVLGRQNMDSCFSPNL
jgi:isopenicillin-N epimerase